MSGATQICLQPYTEVSGAVQSPLEPYSGARSRANLSGRTDSFGAAHSDSELHKDAWIHPRSCGDVQSYLELRRIVEGRT